MKRQGTLTLLLASALAFAIGCNQESPDASTSMIRPAHAQVAGETTGAQTGKQMEREPDVHFVPTPAPVIHRMLTMAKVGPKDVVYDLGCGDGRIVIAAARDFGARAVGIDIDPQRVAEARANVKRAGVEDKVEIRQGDLFKADLSEATVVTLYLLESLNEKLKPKLQRELDPGDRVVSQSFSMGDWQPDAQATVDGTPIYMWTIKREHARR